MRRALLIAALILLVGDASGVIALLIPETCGIAESATSPDSGCPAFCVRCSCGCCAAPVVHKTPVLLAEALVPSVVAAPDPDRLPAGIRPDILHVPKPVLA
jgi:hypothetical protein